MARSQPRPMPRNTFHEWHADMDCCLGGTNEGPATRLANRFRFMKITLHVHVHTPHTPRHAYMASGTDCGLLCNHTNIHVAKPWHEDSRNIDEHRNLVTHANQKYMYMDRAGVVLTKLTSTQYYTTSPATYHAIVQCPLGG